MNTSSTMVHDDALFFGCVYDGRVWRFFYEEKALWTLDREKYLEGLFHTIPQPYKIQDLDENNSKIYLDTLGGEYTIEQLSSTTNLAPLSFIVNFEEKLFVDNVFETPEDLTEYMPLHWSGSRDEVYLYVPSFIRRLWVHKHIIFSQDGKRRVLIPMYVCIGAVKLHGSWRFFAEAPATFTLDFSKMIRESHSDYFSGPQYGDWRRQLPLVDTSNAEAYIESLAHFELSYEDIRDMRHISQRLDQRPPLSFIIDFDSQIFLSKGYYNASAKRNVASKYIPPEWKSDILADYTYLPSDLQNLWSDS